MKYVNVCECCGSQITAYTHKLNQPLANALRQLVVFYERNGRACKLQKDLPLTINQYNNFQKLQYFKLVQRTKKGYFPTRKGSAFVYGEIKVYDMVATFGSTILDYDHEAWNTVRKQPKEV